MINRTTIESDEATIKIGRDFQNYCNIEMSYAGDIVEMLMTRHELEHLIRVLIGHRNEMKAKVVQ